MKDKEQLTSAEYLRSINKNYSQLTADENKEYHRCHRRTSKRHAETAAARSAYNIKYQKEYRRSAVHLSKAAQRSAYEKEYALNNKESIAKRRKYRYQNDTDYRHRILLRQFLSNHLKRTNEQKVSWFHHVGCTKEEFTHHIESQFTEGMSWDNWATNGWHMDHIHPLSKGGTNHYTNIQPLWWYDNLSKSDKIV